MLRPRGCHFAPSPCALCNQGTLTVHGASPWFSPEKAYPQYMQSLFRYVCSSPLRHSHRVPAPILTLSSVQPCAARAARVVFDWINRSYPARLASPLTCVDWKMHFDSAPNAQAAELILARTSFVSVPSLVIIHSFPCWCSQVSKLWYHRNESTVR